MQSFYGAVAKSPSPATNGYFSSGGSCGSSCAPRAETGNGAFGEGIFRDSSGVPPVPASFFFAGWIINGRLRQPRGLSPLPTGDHEKVIRQRLHTPMFFPILSPARPGVQKSFYHQSHWSKVGICQTSSKIGKMDLISTWSEAKAVPPPIFASNGAPNGAANGAQRRSDAALQLDRQLRGVETVSVPRHV